MTKVKYIYEIDFGTHKRVKEYLAETPEDIRRINKIFRDSAEGKTVDTYKCIKAIPFNC